MRASLRAVRPASAVISSSCSPAGTPIPARRHHWRLYTHVPVTVPAGVAGARVILPGAGGTQWEQWTLPRALARQKPDVLFAPGYTAPLTAPCPCA